MGAHTVVKSFRVEDVCKLLPVCLSLALCLLFVCDFSIDVCDFSIDGSIYNVEPASCKVRRRIRLSNISHLSTSLFSDNFFLVHVPSEYDYVYASGRKTEIVAILRLAYQEAMGEELPLVMQNM